MACKDCLYYEVCMLVDRSAGADNEPCDRFTAFENCEVVVRCKNCIHSAHPEERIVWCKRKREYMPLKGFCSDGKEKEQ